MKKLVYLIIFTACSLIFPREVLAYLDPGAGSYVTQILLGIVFGGLVTIKLYWKKIKGFFIRSKDDKKEKDDK